MTEIGAAASRVRAFARAADGTETDITEVDRYAAHLPVIVDALKIAIASGGYQYEREDYEAALEALGQARPVYQSACPCSPSLPYLTTM